MRAEVRKAWKASEGIDPTSATELLGRQADCPKPAARKRGKSEIKFSPNEAIRLLRINDFHFWKRPKAVRLLKTNNLSRKSR